MPDSNLLNVLTKHDMHVHEITEAENLPVHLTAIDTHYIMRGADIVFTGSLVSLERWVLSYERNQND